MGSTAFPEVSSKVGKTLLSSTILNGLSSSAISVPLGYSDLLLEISGTYSATDGDHIRLRYNNDSTMAYYGSQVGANSALSDPYIDLNYAYGAAAAADKAALQTTKVFITGYATNNPMKLTTAFGIGPSLAGSFAMRVNNISMFYNNTNLISTLNLSLQSAGTFTAGTANLYGIV